MSRYVLAVARGDCPPDAIVYDYTGGNGPDPDAIATETGIACVVVTGAPDGLGDPFVVESYALALIPDEADTRPPEELDA